MNIKRFVIIGMMSLFALVGCQSTQSVSQSVESAPEATPEASPEVKESPSPEPSKEPEVDQATINQQTATEQIQTLAGLIGKTAKEVDTVLGEPANIQNLEETDILLVRYYKLEYLKEIAKVEVVFNDNEQVVNYISFVILKADDIDATKENLAHSLTELYGESTIERYLNVNGRQNRNWYDENLTYELTYYENNISLDIYPSDK